jgi:hypothetical protein
MRGTAGDGSCSGESAVLGVLEDRADLGYLPGDDCGATGDGSCSGESAVLGVLEDRADLGCLPGDDCGVTASSFSSYLLFASFLRGRKRGNIAKAKQSIEKEPAIATSWGLYPRMR